MRVFVGVLIFLCVISFSLAYGLPLPMKGNYIYTQVDDTGTLGHGFSYPGIQYDPSGSGNFPGILGGTDFLKPGSPWEGFYISTNQTGVVGNNNDNLLKIPGVVVYDLSSPYDNAVSWTGGYLSYFKVEIDVYFNDDDQYIMFDTTITALTDLTDVEFLRTIDPDQDYYSYSTFGTKNARGYGIISEEDWVYASGPYSNWTIGLYSNSSLTHNTGISYDWETDPSFYLAGNDDGNGDNTIGIAFLIGDLNAGDSVSFSYAYVLGTDPADAASHIPTGPSPVPEPASVLLVLVGLILGGGYVKISRKL